MSPLRVFLVVLMSLAWVPTPLSAQPIGSSEPKTARLLSELDLSSKQKRQIGTLLVGTNKTSIRLTADMDIAGIDLRGELEKLTVSEEKVGRLIAQISALEGELRKSRIISWLRIRKLLSIQQRRRLNTLEQISKVGRISARPDNPRKRPVEDPFKSQDSESADCDEVTCLVNPSNACCKQLAEVTKEVARHKQVGKSADCDEVTCLVNPEKACCKNATLIVVTKPTAMIYVNGRKVGMSPLKHKLHAGAHKVKAVFRDGSPAKVSTIRIKAGARHKIAWISKNN